MPRKSLDLTTYKATFTSTSAGKETHDHFEVKAVQREDKTWGPPVYTMFEAIPIVLIGVTEGRAFYKLDYDFAKRHGVPHVPIGGL